MFYTSCENACPIIVGEMKRILDALPDASRPRPRLVLVSFDSDHDTPAILRLYRARLRLGNEYVLLHGQPDDVRELAMVLGVSYAQDARGQFAHSNLITILNRAGEIAFQRPGLAGDISAAVNALALAAR
jgi:protein SCO1/2